jgi:hypothetical protein
MIFVLSRDANKLMSLLHPNMQLTVPFQTEVILDKLNALQIFKTLDQVMIDFNYNNVLIDGYING